MFFVVALLLKILIKLRSPRTICSCLISNWLEDARHYQGRASNFRCTNSSTCKVQYTMKFSKPKLSDGVAKYVPHS